MKSRDSEKDTLSFENLQSSARKRRDPRMELPKACTSCALVKAQVETCREIAFE